jgi:tetratricopeptide (TPR) repeat protein
MTVRGLPAVLVACVAAWLWSAPLQARADELQDITALFQQGNRARALERVNAYLENKPNDAQARFLKGLILTEERKSEEAIKVYQAMIEDYPELPEPYNNLAALYAAQGHYDRARSALEMAINLHPGYATAYENLGDIYARLASQAYDKALQLDKKNPAAQMKLQTIRELFSKAATPSLKSSPPASPAEKASESPTPPPPSAAPAGPGGKAPATGERSNELSGALDGRNRAWPEIDACCRTSNLAQRREAPYGEVRHIARQDTA